MTKYERTLKIIEERRDSFRKRANATSGKMQELWEIEACTLDALLKKLKLELGAR